MFDVGGTPFVGTGNDSMGGLIALFAIFALFGGRGFGRGGEGGHAADIERIQLMTNENTQAGFNRIQSQMDFNGVQAHLSGIQGEIGRLGTTNLLVAKDAEIMGLRNNNETNRNIDGVRTQMAQDTCAIITNQNRLASEGELRAAYAKIAELSQLASEQRITSTILQNLQPPRPVPAYAAQNPFENYTQTVRLAGNNGFFNNCGNGFA